MILCLHNLVCGLRVLHLHIDRLCLQAGGAGHAGGGGGLWQVFSAGSAAARAGTQTRHRHSQRYNLVVHLHIAVWGLELLWNTFKTRA